MHGRPLIVGIIVMIALMQSLVPCERASAQAPAQITTRQLQMMYTEFLAQQGYRPQIDEDGDVIFKFEGKTLFMAVQAEDPQYFTVVLPKAWSVQDSKERTQVLIAANYANATSKVAKVFVIQDEVWVAVELFLDDPMDFRKLFPRSISAIQTTVNQFVAKMRQLQEATPTAP